MKNEKVWRHILYDGDTRNIFIPVSNLYFY